MNYLFKFLLTINSLSLSLIVFLIKDGMVMNSLHHNLSNLPALISYTLYFVIIILFTFAILLLIRFLDTDVIEPGSLVSIEPANDAFLPSYLGYFFVALSVPNFEIFIAVFSIIGIFIFSSRISYFNPIFFLFRYYFYYVKTNDCNKILLISKRILKNPKKLSFNKIKRINDYTFIDIGGD